MERFLVLVLLAGVVGYPVYSRTRQRAAGSPAARVRAVARALAGIVVGVVLALGLPRRVPETPGSPATLVAVLLLWIAGGVLVLLSAAVLIGALLARPVRDAR